MQNAQIHIFLKLWVHNVHTWLEEEKSQEISAKNSGYIFLKSYLSHNHPIAHFLSVRNFSGTFWEPWHLLTGTGLQTKERQVSQVRQTLRDMPQLTRASPKQSRGTQSEKCPGSWGHWQCQTLELRARILKFNFWRPGPILVWILRNFPNLQSFFHLFQYYLMNTYCGLRAQNAELKRYGPWDLPGSPVVRTPRFH